MRVSDLARKTGTTTETVRHYTDIGLLQPVRDPNNGYRRYGNTDLRLLRFALKARSLGFTLADIQSLAEASRSWGTWGFCHRRQNDTCVREPRRILRRVF